MFRRVAAIGASVLLVVCVTAAVWWLRASDTAREDDATALPVPPFPPRITEGSTYEACLTTLASDPVSAVGIAEAWQESGGGDGAVHCRGLALIASGQPDAGAALLEQLARDSPAPALARALVLGQAVQARLMMGQAEMAAGDAALAMGLSPADADLMIMRASAEGMMARYPDAVDDLDEALRLDASRTDALVARAVMHRKLNQLDLAQEDVARAVVLDPDNADALLERGILRQRMGDADGARVDWEHARGVDPTSTTADLAEQNLSLLEVGPRQP
jgi:tetratricopeptide (TPR) repeat protein